MSSQDISLVLLACEQISSTGRKPSTASVRHALPAGFPFPLIINGLKYWESQQKKKARLNTNATQAEDTINCNNTSNSIFSDKDSITNPNNSTNTTTANGTTATKSNASTSANTDAGMKSLMDSLSAEGGHTSITDITAEMTSCVSNSENAQASTSVSDTAYSTIPQESLTTRRDNAQKADIHSRNKATLSEKAKLSDEKFLQLPITEQLLLLKHLLEELHQKL